jgi:hypothetical protein
MLGDKRLPGVLTDNELNFLVTGIIPTASRRPSDATAPGRRFASQG